MYFQDIESKGSYEPEIYKSIIKNNDRLSIIVSSSDMTTVSPYNRLVPGVNDANDFRVNGQPLLQDYLVDNNGYVDLPKLGRRKVAGKSRFELEEELSNDYRKFIKDVIVNIRITNFKVTVLGEVQRPGTYTIPDERVTLPQALGLAGDLTLYGKRNDILLLRDRNGVQESHQIDLTSLEVLESDLFYLQQNDVLYVGPNNAQVNGASFNRNNSLYVSIASVLLSVIILIAR
ncbi:polysaccharide biosynthesis/export family protein [Nonlabens marinus]|uniref:Polysaccharide export outer membrane protein n=1 Tax=Nonlabens marinus S1-08 TaxID=1454201 RepID=W8VWY4_9FLAO|nr:polysaccharide biosynthesis/export family protein [Nonlabens marinus]BAO56723.1 polysaccharide export outer membrane protein [Nonlabens marinus S1-08]